MGVLWHLWVSTKVGWWLSLCVYAMLLHNVVYQLRGMTDNQLMLNFTCINLFKKHLFGCSCIEMYNMLTNPIRFCHANKYQIKIKTQNKPHLQLLLPRMNLVIRNYLLLNQSHKFIECNNTVIKFWAEECNLNLLGGAVVLNVLSCMCSPSDFHFPLQVQKHGY